MSSSSIAPTNDCDVSSQPAASSSTTPPGELNPNGQMGLPDAQVPSHRQLQDLVRDQINHEMNVIRRAGVATREAGKRHARKLSQMVVDLANWSHCHFNSLPNWMQDNDFLHKGHRPPLACFKTCALSIFRIHTETGNIWTHLLGCLLTLGLSAYIYWFAPYAQNMRFMDKLVFGFYLLSATMCLAFSTIFHTFCCHSNEVGRLCGKLDYCGISLLTTGSFVPWIYYAFYCNESLKLFYLTLVPIAGLAVTCMSLSTRFGRPEFRSIRASIFVTFGLSITVPFMHWFWSTKEIHINLFNVILVGVCYVGGAFLYAIRVPERWFPGKCDYVFQSHQIFHILVVTAVLIHYGNIYDISSIYLFKDSDQLCLVR